MNDSTFDATGFNFAPGEGEVTGDSFTPSPLLFWLHTRIAASSTRVQYTSPNTLLGCIPVGENRQTIPIRNIASVDTTTKFNVGPFLIGAALCLAGVSAISNNPGIGVILLVLGIAELLNCMSARLDFVNPSGGRNTVTVSILEKAKLMQLAGQIERRVFTDRDQTRHEETMNLAQRQYETVAQQTRLQQQMLDMQQHDNSTSEPTA